MSKDIKHDSFAVDTFVDTALSHLKENGIPVKRVIMWSDNCGTQYKSCKVFDSMSKFKDIPVMCNYFCAKHGKAEADGAIGRLSVHLDAVVRSGSQEFAAAGEIVHYCNIKLRVHNNDDAMCCHWQWHYFEVSNINRDKSIKCETVKGTLNFHSVRNVGIPGIIEVRESSCFCEVCFVNESGQCKNAQLVEDFAWASLYKNRQIEDNLENKVWECYSVPYRYAKKNTLKSKPKRKISNIKNRNKNSKVGKKMLHTVPSSGHVYSKNHSDDSIYDDSDYEDNIPLQIVQEVIKCKTQRELWDLEDYEAIAPKIEHKPVTKPEYRSLGVEPISPIDNKKQISEVLVTSQFNKLKSTMKVNEGQKMTEFTRTSTPKNNNIYPECRIELSPIQNTVHSTLVQPSFSEHADISDKRNGLKLNLYSDDSNSESDYEDNIPLKVVQEVLNAMSRESTICRRTRNTNHHNVTI